MNAALRILLLLALLLSAGCGSLLNIRLFVVGRQTALERQVLGTYEDLGQDVLSFSSVRGVSPDGELVTPPPATPSQAGAMRAMRNREYNADDVQAILLSGIAGEGNDGMITRRTETITAVGTMSAELVQRVINEENEDRRVLIRRLLATTPGVTDADAPEVIQIFAGIQSDAAPTGAWIQDRNGNWRRK